MTVRVAVPPSATVTSELKDTVGVVSVDARPQLLQRNHVLGLPSEGARTPSTANQYSVPASSPLTVVVCAVPDTPCCPEVPWGGSGTAT